MDNDSSSISERIESSVCDVCKGLFKVDNARSFVTERSPDHYVFTSGCYVYTYVHHAHIVALLASAEAGCGLCLFFINRLKKLDAFSEWKRDAVLRSAHPNSETATAQPDEDVFVATQLAERGRREDIYSHSDLGIHGHGRIVVQIYSDERPRLWWKHGGLFNVVSVLNTGLFAYFRYFQTPCMSDYPRKVFVFGNIADKEQMMPLIPVWSTSLPRICCRSRILHW